jgi:hypothetical protein
MRYALLCFFACAAVAHADLVCLLTVAPSLVVNTNDTCSTDSDGSSPIGTLVADTGTQAFDFTGSGVDSTGDLRVVVYQEAAGNLDFLIQLNVAATSAGSVLAVSTGGGKENRQSISHYIHCWRARLRRRCRIAQPLN